MPYDSTACARKSHHYDLAPEMDADNLNRNNGNKGIVKTW